MVAVQCLLNKMICNYKDNSQFVKNIKLSGLQREESLQMKKRVYVLIVFISMILFTKPVFLWIDKLTMDTVEANKASYTNQDALLIVLAAIGGSLLLAALPGVIVSIVLRIVKGKPVRNHMETARVRPVKKEKKKKERRKPTRQEVVHRLVAVAGLLLAVYSFYFAPGLNMHHWMGIFFMRLQKVNWREIWAMPYWKRKD